MKRPSALRCRSVWSQLRRYASSQSGISKESPAWQAHAARIDAGERKHALQVLEERGLVKSLAGDRSALAERLTSQRVSAYSGIDPTAPSLHVGHLIPLNALFWLYASGHSVISLIGDTTAAIGDPTDRLKARDAMGNSTQTTNAAKMKKQLSRLWNNVDSMLETAGRKMHGDTYGYREDLGPQRQIENNARWLQQIPLMHYLRTMGRCAKMGAMLSRDTVRNRLEQGSSMTLAEFNYPLLQAWDWFHMFAEKGTEIQIGGSDQYGNIVAGIDYINYMKKHHTDECVIGRPQLNSETKTPYGITTPLLESSSGEKFGKSAGNAIWLDADMTSPFDLYGHLLRTSDDDVERFLKLLTLVPLEQIESTMILHRQDPSQRHAQHLLARQICQLAHGAIITDSTVAQHTASRRPDVSNMLDDAGSILLPRSLVLSSQVTSLASTVGVTASAKEARKLRDQGGLYAAKQVAGEEMQFERVNAQLGIAEYLIGDRYIVLRSGKWKTVRIELVEDNEFELRGLQVDGLEDWRAKVKENEDRRHGR